MLFLILWLSVVLLLPLLEYFKPEQVTALKTLGG